ncbi:MAG: DUF4064 domain-containing protein [Lachnospiraceae bacterium]|nr:DUF4064 domain-containing protein [Lachnospiraceae bacterium]
MPFCPKCKNEYRKGFTECHECKIPLVESLDEADEMQIKPKRVFDVNDERSYEFLDQYKEDDEEEEVSEIVSYSDLTFSEKQFQKNEEDDDDLEVVAPISEQMMRQRQIAEAISKQSSYVDKKQKIEDYKSSGFVLTLVGGVGLVALVLLYLGIFPGFSGLKSNYMFMGVMLVMFIVFIIAGIVSFAQIKTIILEAEADDDLISRVNQFFDEYLTVEKLAKEVVCGKNDTEEELYFKRTEYMTRVLLQKFPEMNESLREKIIDDKYGEMYENNNH